MAKFNSGQVGGIFYKASPKGFRGYFWLYKLIPYLVGYDINVALTITQSTTDVPWNRGVLLVSPSDDRPPNKPFSLDYENGKLVLEHHFCHPSHRGQFTCTLFLEETKQAADGAVVCIRQEQAELIEDLRVESLYKVIAWTIGVLIALSGIIVGIVRAS
ncbi:MAG: hypothetical protein HYX79_01005 [Chloroflexi bacterium]|nr:hypothetical protein [Chloroflexota bacterium]